MVSDSGASLRPHQLRSLNAPRPAVVSCDAEGRPVAVRFRGALRRVASICDVWRLDDEWWRERLSRLYYVVEYEDGLCETLYCDLTCGEWYRQRDGGR